jgi:hypothetical protein
LITATAPVAAALGAVGLRERYSSQREKASAATAADATRKREVQDAYLGVVKSARASVAAFSNLDDPMHLGPGSQVHEAARAQIAELAGDLHEAIALVEIVGSPEAVAAAKPLLWTPRYDDSNQGTVSDIDDQIKHFLEFIRGDIS